MLYPAGILKNEKTGRFHPIIFRDAPMPGNADAKMMLQRYKSRGHHTEGFDTLEQAQKHIADTRGKEHEFVDSGLVWEWDGEGVPAMVEFFNLGELLKSRPAAAEAPTT